MIEDYYLKCGIRHRQLAFSLLALKPSSRTILCRKSGVKAPSFLMGFTIFYRFRQQNIIHHLLVSCLHYFLYIVSDKSIIHGKDNFLIFKFYAILQPVIVKQSFFIKSAIWSTEWNGDNMSKDERRINKRLDTKFEISYVHENDYLISFTKNISADGMFVNTERPLAVGSTIKLIFSIGNFKKIEINAKVMWINKGASSKDTGMGVKFLNVPARTKDAILKEINIVAVL